ncbi:hypothetical protein GCM10010967_11910 [Dyadobacter beijingensis]|uniref:DUF6602 domain-containing protein n=1 Tax=Dyadobacter beijingensis TaxID=365489 RepID=A0ABQ2HHE0_9BACT|nr:DUF6602 domain-containing protein [Dyadobacter beijingensis]GGM81783.1 hypothetical protein GCM10010967_11910 [Dyadobacter beijingensis]
MGNNAVYASLIENLQQLELIFSPTEEAFKVDRYSTGDKKEVSVQDFIKSYLTYDYRIAKGHIFSQTDASQSIDCVVLAPNHPDLLTPKRKIILAEGVYAAVEIKPDIHNKAEFLRGLNQCKSVKALQRPVQRLEIPEADIQPYKEFQKRIPSVIFSAKSMAPADTANYLCEKIATGEFTIYDYPDLIFTLDNGLFVISPDMAHTPFSRHLLRINQEFASRTLFHFEGKTRAENLAMFIIHFLSLPAAFMQLAESILIKYLLNLQDFNVKTWPLPKQSPFQS